MFAISSAPANERRDVVRFVGESDKRLVGQSQLAVGDLSLTPGQIDKHDLLVLTTAQRIGLGERALRFLVFPGALIKQATPSILGVGTVSRPSSKLVFT